MRGLPHIAENFKIEILEARFFFFAIAPTPLMPTPKPDTKIVPQDGTIGRVLQAEMRRLTQRHGRKILVAVHQKVGVHNFHLSKCTTRT